MLELYCYSTELVKNVPGNVITSSTLGYSYCASEDEARGKAVAFAREQKPDFAVRDVLVMKIELGLQAQKGEE